MSISKIELGKKELSIETGKLARQADGAVLVTYGGTVVLVTACISSNIKEDINFFPLTVEYKEKTYAAGRIPGGFFKREGRPSEREILSARLIDRSIRPLFSKNIKNEIQVMAIVLSSDGENDPDVLGVIGASCALSISGIPFNGPIAAVRIGYLEGEFILNPSFTELQNSKLDVVVVANKSGILMLESVAREVTEDVFLQAVEFGWKNLDGIFALQDDFQHFTRILDVSRRLQCSNQFPDRLAL